MGNLKRDHPVHYWIRLLIVSWIFLAPIFFGFAHGAVTNTNIATHNNAGMTNPAHKYFDRAVNGTWGYVWTSDSWGLYLNKSYDNGSTWETEEVISTSWKGHTALYPIGLHSTWNNTTIITFQTKDADTTNDVYMAVNYSDTVGWLIQSVFASTPYSWTFATTDINYSCVAFVYVYGTQARYMVWDWINITEIASDTIMITYASARPQLTVNVTGDFWAVHMNWDGSYYDFHFRTLDNSVNFKQENVFNLAAPYMLGFEALPNGYFVWFYGFKYTTTYYLYFNRALPDGSDQAKIKIKQTTDEMGTYVGGGITYTTGTLVYLFNDNRADTDLIGWVASYNAIEAVWQASEGVIRSDIPDTGDYIVGKNSISLYPMDPDGNRTNVPTGGQAIAYVLVEELGFPDGYHNWLTWDAIYPDIWAPTPPEEPPDDDDEETEALVDMQCISGALMALVIIIFLMTITVVAMDTAR